MNRFRETRRQVGRSSSRWSFSAQGSGSSNEYSIGNDPDLVAWYDAKSSTITQADATERVSAWSDLSGHGYNLLQATPSAQPILLPDTGVNYAKLPAAASNTLTSPNQTVTGNQTITFDIALNDYTPAADVTLFAKTSGNDGFSVLWLTTDKIRFIVGDGVGLTNVDVVAASGFADFSRHTVIIAWEDGVGATFSYDGVVSGSQVAAAKTLTNAAVAMTVGSTTSIGKVYRLQVGSLYDLNAALAVEISTNGATFVGGAGETWTLNNTGATPAQIVVAGQPSVMGNQANYFIQKSFTLIQPFTLVLVGKMNLWGADDWIVGGGTNYSGILQSTATPQVGIYAGSSVALNSDIALGTYAIWTGVVNGVNSSLRANLGIATTGNAGSGNPGGITIFSDHPGVQHSASQVKALAVFSSAKSQKQIDEIVKWMQGRYAL